MKTLYGFSVRSTSKHGARASQRSSFSPRTSDWHRRSAMNETGFPSMTDAECNKRRTSSPGRTGCIEISSLQCSSPQFATAVRPSVFEIRCLCSSTVGLGIRITKGSSAHNLGVPLRLLAFANGFAHCQPPTQPKREKHSLTSPAANSHVLHRSWSHSDKSECLPGCLSKPYFTRQQGVMLCRRTHAQDTLHLAYLSCTPGC